MRLEQANLIKIIDIDYLLYDSSFYLLWLRITLLELFYADMPTLMYPIAVQSHVISRDIWSFPDTSTSVLGM